MKKNRALSDSFTQLICCPGNLRKLCRILMGLHSRSMQWNIYLVCHYCHLIAWVEPGWNLVTTLLLLLLLLLLLVLQIRGDWAAVTLSQTGRQDVQMLRRCCRTLDSRSRHLHRTATDQTELVLLPLQHQSEDVRPTLGVSCQSVTALSLSALPSSPVPLSSEAEEILQNGGR